MTSPLHKKYRILVLLHNGSIWIEKVQFLSRTKYFEIGFDDWM